MWLCYLSLLFGVGYVASSEYFSKSITDDYMFLPYGFKGKTYLSTGKNCSVTEWYEYDNECGNKQGCSRRFLYKGNRLRINIDNDYDNAYYTALCYHYAGVDISTYGVFRLPNRTDYRNAKYHSAIREYKLNNLFFYHNDFEFPLNFENLGFKEGVITNVKLLWLAQLMDFKFIPETFSMKFSGFPMETRIRLVINGTYGIYNMYLYKFYIEGRIFPMKFYVGKYTTNQTTFDCSKFFTSDAFSNTIDNKLTLISDGDGGLVGTCHASVDLYRGVLMKDSMDIYLSNSEVAGYDYRSPNLYVNKTTRIVYREKIVNHYINNTKIEKIYDCKTTIGTTTPESTIETARTLPMIGIDCPDKPVSNTKLIIITVVMTCIILGMMFGVVTYCHKKKVLPFWSYEIDDSGYLLAKEPPTQGERIHFNLTTNDSSGYQQVDKEDITIDGYNKLDKSTRILPNLPLGNEKKG